MLNSKLMNTGTFRNIRKFFLLLFSFKKRYFIEACVSLAVRARLSTRRSLRYDRPRDFRRVGAKQTGWAAPKTEFA